MSSSPAQATSVPTAFALRRTPGFSLLPIAPAGVVFVSIFAVPILGLLAESFQTFTPGRVGSVADAPLTLQNYLDLVSASFAGVLFETFWISALAAFIGVLIAFPLAFFIVRRFPPRWRAVTIGLMITLVLLSMLVRTYALELTFGSVGVVRPLIFWLGVSPTARWYIDALVAAGLAHAIVPIATLTLLGSVQNIDPRLADAAQSLGAPVWRSHLDVTLPLSLPALISAYLVALTFAISAFVIPMVLGKGRVLFISNVIYTRFSDVANYPSGAAISVVMLVASLIVVYSVSLVRASNRTEK
jgi:putative spermidine/putrescine transport system permease protein